MTSLKSFRDQCRAMADAEHKPDCPSLIAKKPYWDPWVIADGGRSMRWRGPEPPWKPPTCEGCNPESDRSLFAQMADEVDRYQQGGLDE